MKQGQHVRFNARGRRRSLWFLFAALLAAALWEIAQVFGLPIWARAMLAVIAVVMPQIIIELQARFGQSDTWSQLLEQRVTVFGELGQLPLVRDVGLDHLRVHAARVQIPYIERDQQNELAQEIKPARAVLVVGHSMSGKTRLAAEVVRKKFPQALLLAAESGKALRELLDGGLDPAGIVFWLDDIERFLEADGLTIGLLNRLIYRRAIVVATIQIERRERYRPHAELRQSEWEVLQQFSQIMLQRQLTHSELDRVRATVTNLGVLDAVNHYGLAEYLGGGPEALDKYEKGEVSNPIGQALVHAAVDWRRVGFNRPVPYKVLTKLFSVYLFDRPGIPRTQQTLKEGMAWATAKVNETVALLAQNFASKNEDSFECFDYLADHLTNLNIAIPERIWKVSLEQADLPELITIGIVADQTGRIAIAEEAFRKAIASGNTNIKPFAAFNLGLILSQQGDIEGATMAYQQAIQSRHAEIMPKAAFSLGHLLSKQGDIDEARTAYQQAIQSRHAEEMPKAAINLGLLLSKQGDIEGARAAYQQAIASENIELASIAVFNLGKLLSEQGDIEGAKTAYQQAIATGDALAAPMAVFALDDLFSQQGDIEGAKTLYQQVGASGNTVVGPIATYYLGKLLSEQGDIEGAKMAYQQVIASKHHILAPFATLDLGDLLSEQGDKKRARTLYQQVIANGDKGLASSAAYHLGSLLLEQGDIEGAKTAFQQVIASGNTISLPLAAYHLGELLSNQGDLEGARTAFQQVIASGNTISLPLAAFQLGKLLSNQGDIEGARMAYQQVIASGNTGLATFVASNLEELLLIQGDLEEYRTLFQRIIAIIQIRWARNVVQYFKEIQGK